MAIATTISALCTAPDHGLTSIHSVEPPKVAKRDTAALPHRPSEAGRPIRQPARNTGAVRPCSGRPDSRHLPHTEACRRATLDLPPEGIPPLAGSKNHRQLPSARPAPAGLFCGATTPPPAAHPVATPPMPCTAPGPMSPADLRQRNKGRLSADYLPDGPGMPIN